MHDSSSTDSSADRTRPLRPLHGIPEPDRRTSAGWWVSGLLHALILTALLLPPLVGKLLEETAPAGAGGPGPSGGGGGGSGGSGGEIVPERIRYLDVQGQATPPPPTTQPTPTPTPAPVPPPPEPAPEPQAASVQEPAAPAPAAPGASAGSGGGSGNDGSSGSGPGSGGGVGSSVGTGRGAGVGPGTGGGDGSVFPPKVTNLAILPLPVPNGVRPYRMVAHFEVDERGNARLISFTPSRNRGYNAKLRDMLTELRFLPATRAADGRPVLDTAVVVMEAP